MYTESMKALFKLREMDPGDPDDGMQNEPETKVTTSEDNQLEPVSQPAAEPQPAPLRQAALAAASASGQAPPAPAPCTTLSPVLPPGNPASPAPITADHAYLR